jgi:hypothetical protein
MIVEIVRSHCIFSFVNDLGIYATILEMSMLCLEPAFSLPCVGLSILSLSINQFRKEV